MVEKSMCKFCGRMLDGAKACWECIGRERPSLSGIYLAGLALVIFIIFFLFGWVLTFLSRGNDSLKFCSLDLFTQSSRFPIYVLTVIQTSLMAIAVERLIMSERQRNWDKLNL